MIQFIVFSALFNLVLSDFDVLLLHNNDMHAHFAPVTQGIGNCHDYTSPKCYGGFARTKSVAEQKIQEAAEKGRRTIFLNAGDSFHGTAYYRFFKWDIVAEFVDMLGLQVMSLGNQEFDDGVTGLSLYIKNVSVPIVCANLDTTLEPTMTNLTNLTPSYVLDVNGTKIGVIGYLTPATTETYLTGRVRIFDEIDSIRSEAKNLLSKGVNILIALGHSGYVKDQQIAAEVEEIDLVVGGHSHTFLYSGTPPDSDVPKGPYPTIVKQSTGKQVPVVQAYYATKYLGFLELNFDDSGNLLSWNGQPILLSGNWSQDPAVALALEPYKQNISTRVNAIVGSTPVLLDNIHMKCKLGECNIGNLFTDAFVDYVTQNFNHTKGWTFAAIGLIQGGAIRASIDTSTNNYKNGSISLNDIITALPWGRNVAIMSITGSTLLKALEWSVSRYEYTHTGHISEFLQVSGLHVVYDVTRTVGSRVVSVNVLCADCIVPGYEPLQLNKSYGVVSLQYLAKGGDNFTMFRNAEVTLLEDVDFMVVAKYVETHSPVYPSIENRIVIITSSTSPASSMTSSWTVLSVTVVIVIHTL